MWLDDYMKAGGRMLRMDQVYVIRHKVLVEGQSIRKTAKDLGVSRNTVRRYLKRSEPVREEPRRRLRPVVDRAGPEIEQILEDWDARSTRKQRVTGTRLHRELRKRDVDVGVTTVRAYLREKRRLQAEVYIPLVYRPGEVAQVDFFEVTVEIEGRRLKAWMFLIYLMYSGRTFGQLYERCDQGRPRASVRASRSDPLAPGLRQSDSRGEEDRPRRSRPDRPVPGLGQSLLVRAVLRAPR